MDVLLSNVAGMDVHQKEIVVCVLSGSEDESLQKEIQSFSTLTKSLYELLEWLGKRQVTHIAMESTGIYWVPVYNILEGYFDITLANAQRIKNVPGRKTDASDAEWIAKLLRHGLIEKSFVPSRDLRELRDLTRLRKKWIANLTAEKNRISKVLECSNIKLGSVISDIFGVSGRKLLHHLVDQGHLEKEEIDTCLHHSLKKKADTISDSLFGTLNQHQMYMIKSSWNHIVFLETSLQQLEAKIDELLIPYQEEKEILLSIPGIKTNTAACIIAEIGTDMSQFPSSRHLASWAGVSPGNNESAGKKKAEKAFQEIRISKQHFAKWVGQYLGQKTQECQPSFGHSLQEEERKKHYRPLHTKFSELFTPCSFISNPTQNHVWLADHSKFNMIF